MKNNEALNLEIKKALLKRVERLEPGIGGFESIRERLSRKEDTVEVTKRYVGKIYNGMRRPVVSLCCVALMLTIVCTLNPSVRAWGQEGITKLIYDVVKGEDGKYKTVQVETEVKKGPEVRMLEDKDLSFKYKAPRSIAEDYTASEMISHDATGNSCSLFYRNGDASLVLSMTNQDYLIYCAKTEGENRKELDIQGVKVYYGEEVSPEYPLVQDSDGLWTFDMTQPPTAIKTDHQFTWEHKDITYQLDDQGAGISNDIMEQAVEDIIKYQTVK
ncbi:hypothetical protein [Aminipila terrae]|uniref:DUF4367 domain-containing protein n=1 Tax=Aminipila terrae TaxID=2697030 RepID=A0A6P1MG99_9FIRM|nr:hypothetical protein [Aminipila terrae]QHI72771.1 hypothetical protein Ami3637_10460 [Aminipila terrae]